MRSTRLILRGRIFHNMKYFSPNRIRKNGNGYFYESIHPDSKNENTMSEFALNDVFRDRNKSVF